MFETEGKHLGCVSLVVLIELYDGIHLSTARHHQMFSKLKKKNPVKLE